MQSGSGEEEFAILPTGLKVSLLDCRLAHWREKSRDWRPNCHVLTYSGLPAGSLAGGRSHVIGDQTAMC